MKTPQHRDQSQKVLTRLTDWGLPPAVQQRIGALGIIWGKFETNLEITIWALKGEDVAGFRPSTDKMPISQWIDEMAEGSSRLSGESQEVLCAAACAAKDLMDYRHSLVHGWHIPYKDSSTFIRNPSWHGELRNRPGGDAHVNENLLDMAIDAAWILCRVVVAARMACDDESKAADLVALKNDVSRARSEANELRHLTALMNQEKY